MTGRPLILAIEDETPILRFLRAALTGNGFTLIEATTGQEGLALAATRQPAIVILDLGLPDMDGLEVTRRLREWSQMPIVILSARGQESDKVAALDAGADDYLTKPFGMPELLARLRVALRHAARDAGAPEDPVFQVDELRVDLARHQVWVGDVEVRLTPLEFKLLAVLVRHAGRMVTHRELLAQVWGPSFTRETHYLRIYVGQLRHKLERDPARPRWLQTEPGVGYRLKSEDQGPGPGGARTA